MRSFSEENFAQMKHVRNACLMFWWHYSHTWEQEHMFYYLFNAYRCSYMKRLISQIVSESLTVIQNRTLINSRSRRVCADPQLHSSSRVSHSYHFTEESSVNQLLQKLVTWQLSRLGFIFFNVEHKISFEYNIRTLNVFVCMTICLNIYLRTFLVHYESVLQAFLNPCSFPM